MRKESDPSFFIKEEVNRLMAAAKAEKWDKVDEEIIPMIEKNPNGNGIAAELLKYVKDKDANIRDAVATGLKAVIIDDENILGKAVKEMSLMATTDEEKFPAGRAALFLYAYSSRPEYGMEIDEALSDFRKLVKEENWEQELEENIPQLKLVLK